MFLLRGSRKAARPRADRSLMIVPRLAIKYKLNCVDPSWPTYGFFPDEP